jgi:putative ABC transport system permease protein
MPPLTWRRATCSPPRRRNEGGQVNLVAILRIALKALRVNKLRSALTMLGMIIGVAAVIAMIGIGSGAQERVREQIKSLGTNLILIFPGSTTASGVRLGSGSQQTLTEEDAAALARDVEGIVVAAPMLRGSGQVVAGNANWATQFFGTTNDYLIARDWGLSAGRVFEEAELSGAGKVALIGLTTAEKLFGEGVDPVDQVIRVRKVPLTIIGVLGRKGQNSLGQDQDDIVLMPIATARNRVLGQTGGRQKRIGSISVKTADGADMKLIEERMRDVLRQRLRVQPGADEPFTIRNLTEILQTQEAASRVLTLLLGAVASVSLLVGGIGIMNIMLVSVTERTREIGLRMAVGARARDILQQFLVEAIVLSLIGGLVGIALGVGASMAIAQFANWNTDITPQAIALAVGFAAAVGVFFGFYPARKASRLLPIEALRYE